MNKKIIIPVIIAVAVSIASYVYFSQTNDTSFPTIGDIKEKLGGEPSTSDWKLYTNTVYGFSIKYPSHYEAKEANGGAFFLPPELKDIVAPPKTLTELPLGIITPLDDESYSLSKIREEIKQQSEGVEYSEETEKVIAGIQGIALKLGPRSEVGDNLHKLHYIIPYSNTVLIFMTYAISKEQLEEKGTPFLDAFISTFQVYPQ